MTEPARITGHARETTHVSKGIARLARQFRGQPVIRAILTTWLSQVQELENALWAVLVNTTLDNAEGDALEQLGALVGMARGALGITPWTDEEYRTVLRATILANRSNGTGDDLLAILHRLLGSWGVSLTEYFPAALVAEPDASPALGSQALFTLLRRAKAGGVQLQVVDVPEGDAFTFASGEAVETDAAHGFSDTSGLTGGELVGVLA